MADGHEQDHSNSGNVKSSEEQGKFYPQETKKADYGDAESDHSASQQRLPKFQTVKVCYSIYEVLNRLIRLSLVIWNMNVLILV